jgi:uncharacterized damage-inducible protein DinB
MVEDRDELLGHYRQSREALLAAIEGLTDEQMVDPSIDGWSVKDHLAHLAAWDDIRASEVVRISAGHDSVWRMDEGQDESYNTMSYELRRNLSLEQAKWEFATSRQRLLDAIAASTPRGLDASLYGESPIRSGHEPEHTEWIKRWRSEKGF